MICGIPTRWRIPEMDMSFCCNTSVLLVAKSGWRREERRPIALCLTSKKN